MFKTFPEFSKLTLKDREEYEAFIKDFPPIGDISFAGLMTWWDSPSGVEVSILDNNLVVHYWRPGDEENSGLSLIATNKIDESICTIFDYLRERNMPEKLVNVPEFVIGEIQYHELFRLSEQRCYNEYVMPTTRFFPLKNIGQIRRGRIERQLKKFGESNITMRSLDLEDEDQRGLLLSMAEKWCPRNLNNFGSVGLEALKKCIDSADQLGMENVCFFNKQEMLGFCLYRLTPDKNYAILMHIKATNVHTLGFELIGYMLARWFSAQGIAQANLTEDWGRMRLRMFMLTLGPVNFFRKYTIEPA